MTTGSEPEVITGNEPEVTRILNRKWLPNGPEVTRSIPEVTRYEPEVTRYEPEVTSISNRKWRPEVIQKWTGSE